MQSWAGGLGVPGKASGCSLHVFSEVEMDGLQNRRGRCGGGPSLGWRGLLWPGRAGVGLQAPGLFPAPGGL